MSCWSTTGLELPSLLCSETINRYILRDRTTGPLQVKTTYKVSSASRTRRDSQSADWQPRTVLAGQSETAFFERVGKQLQEAPILCKLLPTILPLSSKIQPLDWPSLQTALITGASIGMHLDGRGCCPHPDDYQCN